MKKTVCVFTGTRAEYGLMKNLILRLSEDESINFKLIVGGTHLSREHGYTITEIEEDGVEVSEKLDFLLQSGTDSSVLKSMGLLMIQLSESFERLRPDILILLGDRFETFAAASAAVTMKIPLAHIHGGEITEGAIDDQFRHAVTKMSHIHFTSTEVYAKRVVQMGEWPETVYYVGALGLEDIGKNSFVPKRELEEFLMFSLDKPFFIVTIHPETMSHDSSLDADAICRFCAEREGFKFVFTGSNADAGGGRINSIVKDYVSKYPDNLCFVNSMGKRRYMGALCHASGVIGNSSSGIIEAPSFGIPVINIGTRQAGRVRADLVIDSGSSYSELGKAFHTATSDGFIKFAKSCSNPYLKNQNPSLEIFTAVKEFLNSDDIKKKFYDIEFTI